MGAKGITNRGSFRDFKLGQKDYKSGQGFQVGARGILKWGRDYKSGHNILFYNIFVHSLSKKYNASIVCINLCHYALVL